MISRITLGKYRKCITFALQKSSTYLNKMNIQANGSIYVYKEE
jgi:hypothetical protein